MTLKRLLPLLSHLSTLEEDTEVELAITCHSDDEFPVICADLKEIGIDEDGTIVLRGPRMNG